jgi:hypothetical protein
VSEESSFAELDPQISEAVEGLVYLGALTKEVEFCGHTFGLRTLKASEEIAAAKAIEPFRNTLKEPEAWAAVQVGLALTHIDGDDTFCPPIGPDATSFAKARYKYVTTSWYQPVIDFLFKVYADLLAEQVEAIRAVEDLSSRSLHTFLPSADSFDPSGILNEETLSEIHS